MNNPFVSIIMSVFNDERYLPDSIESILSQTYKNFEFIIVNDGSSDSSLKILEHYAALDDRIVLLDQKNHGLTKSLNRALGICKGDYIARMDSDDISDSLRIEKQIDFLMKNQEYALVGTNVVKIDKNGKQLYINSTKYRDNSIRKTLKYRNCFAHGSVMINSKIISGKIRYDEDFKYAQDYKLWTSIAKSHKVANLKEPLYKLRIHDKSITQKNIEEQSIYAGIVAYEFHFQKNIDDIDDAIVHNKELRKKIGIILLFNGQAELSRRYLSKSDPYYYASKIAKILRMKRIKTLIKKIR